MCSLTMLVNGPSHTKTNNNVLEIIVGQSWLDYGIYGGSSFYFYIAYNCLNNTWDI
jgi:hypothetical protein